MDAMKKIRDFVYDKSLQDNLKQIPDKGTYAINLGYDIAINTKYPDMIFVIYKQYSYKNHSITNIRWCVYAFDKKTGELVPNFQDSPKCYDGFYSESELIEQLV